MHSDLERPVTLTETAAASLVTATAIAVASTMLPAPLLLPAFSIAAVTAALAAGLFSWLLKREQRTAHVNSWDVAGGLMFVGVAAALMSNPEAALAAFDQTTLTTASITR